MANETSALRGEPQHAATRLAEDDYQSFSAALGASARGRAFLHEYAKRNRHADTEVVLAALDRLETVARSQKSAPEAERIRQDLRALLDTIRSARPQIDSTPGAIKAATLAALIEFVQARIEALVQPTYAPLASVPEPEQPELPIPQPGSPAQRTIALVQAIAAPPQPVTIAAPVATPEPVPVPPRAAEPVSAFGIGLFEPARSTKIIPEVNFIDSLFDEIDAKNAAKKQAAAETPAPAAAYVFEAVEPPQVTAAKRPIAMPGPVGGLVAAPSEPVAAVVEEAIVESAAVNDTVAEFVAAAPVVMETVQEIPAADVIAPVVVADPSQQAMNEALAAIMALSEEERLAMFT